MELANYFGIDVSARFDGWFRTDFADMIKARFGMDKIMSLIILDPDDACDALVNWREPLRNAMITADIGSADRVTSPTGTRNNVCGKLRYVLRTGRNSVEAETSHGSRREGDFPWEGAGIYYPAGSGLTYIGGVSGLAKEEDWEMFVHCVEQLHGMIVMVDAAAKHKYDSLRAADDLPDEWKYMDGLTISQLELSYFCEVAKVAHWDFSHPESAGNDT
jgi:hypothetical protein